jgi:hypothetical protein
MALTGKKEEAERLYVKQSMSCPAIAAELGVNEGTVYRWKAEAAEKGESENWDTKRRSQHVSGWELIEIYIESIRDWFLQIRDNPLMIADSKVADALAKHFKNLKNLDVRGQYLHAVRDLMKITNRWLAENQPELREKMEPYWDSIFNVLAEYSTGKDIRNLLK